MRFVIKVYSKYNTIKDRIGHVTASLRCYSLQEIVKLNLKRADPTLINHLPKKDPSLRDISRENKWKR